MRPSPRRLLVTGGILLAVLATGCAPGSDNDDNEETKAADVDTDVAGMGDIELTVWDQETRPAMDKHVEALNAEFEDKYPNVTINRVSRSFDDLRKTLGLAISNDNDPPDVVQANNGRSDMGKFVGGNQLESLDGYAEAYGWDDRYPEDVLARSSYSEDGKEFGEGTLWGVPITGELVGLWYNKAKLDELKLDVPKTTEDFEAALAKAKDAGEVPIQFGNLEGWPGIHDYGFVQNQFAAKDDIDKLAFGREGASWTSEENVAAAGAFADWSESGYFTDDFNGVKYDDAWKDFANGDGVFLVAGTWLLNESLPQDLGDDLGFTLPPAGESGEQLVTGGTGLPFGITANSEHPDAAAAYIDFLTTKESMAGIADSGGLPVIDTAEAKTSGVQSEVFDAWTEANESDLMTPYLDYATPDFYDLLVSEVQKLSGGSADADGFTGALEDEYTEFTSEH